MSINLIAFVYTNGETLHDVEGLAGAALDTKYSREISYWPSEWRDSTNLRHTLIQLESVPDVIADRLMKHGTNHQFYSDGYGAWEEALHYAGVIGYISPMLKRTTDAFPLPWRVYSQIDDEDSVYGIRDNRLILIVKAYGSAPANVLAQIVKVMNLVPALVETADALCDATNSILEYEEDDVLHARVSNLEEQLNKLKGAIVRA